ncbi:MAG: FAD-dependent oxidoreductase, partial [Burkholderiaceae bacterium]|nr:FAD-dependent oxidoreductase [Burkholderiaceae bacterium]
RDGPDQAFRLACPRLPAPLHSAITLLRAAGLSWAERLAAVRAMNTAKRLGWRLPADTTVQAWLESQGQSTQLIRCLWEPLTLAALNTPIATASAQVLLNVLRDSLAADRAASDFLVPRADLSALFPDAAGAYITTQGGQVQLGAMVKSLEHNAAGWHTDRGDQHYRAVVLALPPHRLAMLTSTNPAVVSATAATQGWAYQPIYTVYLGFPEGTRLPKPMLGMVNTTTQWLFDRGAWCGQPGIISAVVSAEGPHQRLSQDALAELVIAETLRACPDLPQPLWHKVIAEKRATFACTPGLLRPGNATQDTSLVLAGDYTAGDYPATIEGAVRSGVAAARLLLSPGTVTSY